MCGQKNNLISKKFRNHQMVRYNKALPFGGFDCVTAPSPLSLTQSAVNENNIPAVSCVHQSAKNSNDKIQRKTAFKSPGNDHII